VRAIECRDAVGNCGGALDIEIDDRTTIDGSAPIRPSERNVDHHVEDERCSGHTVITMNDNTTAPRQNAFDQMRRTRVASFPT
jgi:hypothetical protein